MALYKKAGLIPWEDVCLRCCSLDFIAMFFFFPTSIELETGEFRGHTTSEFYDLILDLPLVFRFMVIMRVCFV